MADTTSGGTGSRTFTGKSHQSVQDALDDALKHATAGHPDKGGRFTVTEWGVDAETLEKKKEFFVTIRGH